MKRSPLQLVPWAVVWMLGLTMPVHAQEGRLASFEPSQLASMYVSARAQPGQIPALDRRIAVDLDETTMEQALAQIAARTGLRLTYSTDLLPEDRRISLHLPRITAAEAVLRVLRGTSLDLLVAPSGDAVVVTHAGAAEPAPARQSATISGLITDDASGLPISGAAVSLVDAGLSTTTDTGGRYSIANVTAGTHRIRVGIVGYAAQERSVAVVAGQSTVANFALHAQAISLEGVVAVGYGTQKAKDVTGAVSSVRAEDIKQIPTSNAVDAIKGRVAGVDIVASGYAPGAGMQVRVRGTRSINAGNDPLYVVDGVPIAGGIQDFNPQNIQSIEVLKDASATAVYGSRGANGVVLITTNQGRRGETRITYDTYAGVQKIIHKVPMMNGEEFAEHKREAYRAAGRYTSDEDLFYPVELESLGLGRSTDWQDLVLRTGLQQSHQLGVTGGDENTRFALNANYFDQTGVTRGQAYDRMSLGFNFDHTANRLRVGISSQVSRSNQQLGRGDLWAEVLYQNPLGVPYDSAGSPLFLPTPDGLRSNPLSDIENFQHEKTRTRLFASLFAEYRLLDWLTWRTNLGPDLAFNAEGQFRGSETSARRLSPADAWRSTASTFAYTFDNMLTADRDVGLDHHVGATLLYSIQRQRDESERGDVSELPYEHQQFYNLGTAGVIQGLGSGMSEWALQSYMGRLNYGFRDRYLLTLTGRVDGSSRLAPGNKYAFFPSIGLGWRLSEEPFVMNTGIFSELKLRGSYGRTGNTSIDPYQTQGSLARTEYVLGGTGAYGYGPQELENPDLEWEKTEQFDVGVDFGLFENRVSGSADFYRANTHDLLLRRQLPSALGFSSILENVGQTRNTGVGLSLSTVNLEGWHGLNWTTDFTWSRNRNEIVSLYGGQQDDVGNEWFIGEPINVFYNYKAAGIWQLDEAAEAKNFAQSPGDPRVVDQDGDGHITAADRVILGTSYPDWTGSISSRMEWKRLDFSVLAIARQGGMIYDSFGKIISLQKIS